MRKVQDMGREERKRTPYPFCLYLYYRVLLRHRADKVAILWICPTTEYDRLWPNVDLWGPSKDANKYNGPWPIIAHPPCGPWGKLSWSSKESKEHGINAMSLVHQYGGVVEQPSGSQLFKLHGRGGHVEKVNQSRFGHRAQKATLLYFVD